MSLYFNYNIYSRFEILFRDNNKIKYACNYWSKILIVSDAFVHINAINNVECVSREMRSLVWNIITISSLAILLEKYI